MQIYLCLIFPWQNVSAVSIGVVIIVVVVSGAVVSAVVSAVVVGIMVELFAFVRAVVYILVSYFGVFQNRFSLI